ncbi:protein ALTERED XYLOGLUCAN 4-like [Hordeum vulgare subsp. vulgare]|uniref:Predicted protein n=1 Tax=Hordeum vulgare subsp. vulgare TaxID=112509 RepID=F2E8N4_HORVV|nr:protein ALTERED XYLOGLUCAN 4-like [Hordeum vulgare subsp. vulgare]BAK03706.1 predicted protein [Hordeum vulgare subsp. vulgare]
MRSSTSVGFCTNRRASQQCLEVVRAAPFAFSLIALSVVLLILVGIHDTSSLRSTMFDSTTRKGGDDEKCDMSTGKWVREPRGPIYTNLTCPTIPGGRNCQKYSKDPRHLYWRWQPDRCELPRFAPARFLDLVRGKRLAFIGDSLAGNQMDSLICLLSQVERPTAMYSDASDKIRKWYFPAHDFTVMALTTRFLVHADPVRDNDWKITNSFDIHLDKLDSVWRSRLPELDYAILSGGNWFFRVNYFLEDGRRVGCTGCHDSVADLTDFGVAGGVRRVVRAALEGIARCRGCKRGLVTLLRTYTPSHFEHGTWYDGGYCNRTRPSEEGEVSLKGVEWELRAVQREEVWRAREASGGKRFFEAMDVTKAMMMRPDGHPNWHSVNRKISNDCLHWCLPGPVDMWNEMLLQRLAEISSPAVAR